MSCNRCGADHPSEGCTRSLVFQGYLFAPPYLCICCGAELDPVRWFHFHSCEGCEGAACYTIEGPTHEQPVWMQTTDGTEALELYAEYLEAIPRRGRG